MLTCSVWDVKPEDGSPAKWVELKTSADIRNDRDMITLERKLMKFWYAHSSIHELLRRLSDLVHK